ncbi:MAG: hypothetical protein ACFCUI_04820 [Bernardetiaceae bacterium]
MKLHFKNELPPQEELMSILQQAFPDHKVKSPWINKKVILIQKGAVMVQVFRRKKGILLIKSTINTQNLWVATGLGLCVLFIIGPLVFLGIMWLIYKKKMENLGIETLDILKKHFGESCFMTP